MKVFELRCRRFAYVLVVTYTIHVCTLLQKNFSDVHFCGIEGLPGAADCRNILSFRLLVSGERVYVFTMASGVSIYVFFLDFSSFKLCFHVWKISTIHSFDS